MANVWKLLYVSVLTGLSYFLGKSIVRSDNLMLLAFLSLFYFTVMVSSEQTGIAIAMIVSFYFPYLWYISSMPYQIFNWLYVPPILLFVRNITNISMNRNSFRTTPMNNGIFVVFGFMLASLVVNGNPLGPALKSMIKQSAFLLVFFIVVNSNLKESVLKNMVWGMIAIALLQIPASIIQYYVIYSGIGPAARADSSSGLLGHSAGGINAVFMTFIFSIMFGFMITYGVSFAFVLICLCINSAASSLANDPGPLL